MDSAVGQLSRSTECISSLTEDHIAAIHGRFNHIRQVALIDSNIIELGPSESRIAQLYLQVTSAYSPGGAAQ